MTVKEAVAHEVWCQRRNCNLQGPSFAEKKSVDGPLSSQWWADSSAGNVASRREGLEAAEEAGSLHGLLDNRSEGNGNTTSMHREGTVFERNDDDDDDEDEDDDEDDVDDDNDNDDGDGDDDDDGSDDDDDNNNNDIDTSRRERM